MKVIFLGDLRSSSNSGSQRFWAMQQCGIDALSLDKQNYSSRFGKWSGPLARVTRQPDILIDSVRLGKDLVGLCEKIKPDILWLEWMREIGPDVLRRIKSIQPRPLLISFQDDNPWGDRHSDRWLWKNYFKLIPELDLHLVKRFSDVQNLKSLGAKNCRFWRHGTYKPLFHPPDFEIEKKYPVSFIGTCMDNRVEFITHLIENNIPVHVFGNRWDTKSNLPRRFPSYFHPAVEGKTYADTIRRSHICLGLVSHSNHDEWTMRTYEVPGCSVTLLAERTSVHEELFTEGREALFYSDAQECANLIHHLLQDTERCKEIGKAAYQKIIKNNWTIEASMKDLFEHLESTDLFAPRSN